MSFRRVIGQEIPKEILKRALEKNRLANTYLFYGPIGVGKFLTAWELAQILLCEKRQDLTAYCGECDSCLRVSALKHPDLYLIFPHPAPTKQSRSKEEQELLEYQNHFKKTKINEPYQMVEYAKPVNISADAIRLVKEQIYRSPFQAEKKVVIIEQAESMRIDSFNLLLKIFEEPPADTVIVLTTSQIDRILPTVISRSQKIRLSSLEREIIKRELLKRFSLTEEKAGNYATLSEGSLGLALNFASGLREKILELSDLLWQALVERKTPQVQEFIEILNAEKERSQILLLIKLWQFWLRDFYLWSAGVESRHLIYQNQLDQYNLYQKRIAPDQIFAACQILNQARLDFYRNLGIKSILIWLCLNLQKTLLSEQ